MSFFAAEQPIVDALKEAIPDIYIGITNQLDASMRGSQIFPAIYVVGLSADPQQSAMRGRAVRYTQTYAVIIAARLVPDGSGNYQKAGSVGSLAHRVVQALQGLPVAGCAEPLQIDGDITPLADRADQILLPLIFKTSFYVETSR